MGPQGPKGPTGALGPTGGRGPTGSAGARGKNIHIANAPVSLTNSFPLSKLTNAQDVRMYDAVLGTNGAVATIMAIGEGYLSLDQP